MPSGHSQPTHAMPPEMNDQEHQHQHQHQHYYSEQNGYMPSTQPASYSGEQLPTSAAIQPTINYPPAMANVYRSTSNAYEYHSNEIGYPHSSIYAPHSQGQLVPYTASPSSVSPSDIFPQSPYTISPGFGHPSFGTPITTPSIGSGYDAHSTDYFGRHGVDTASLGRGDLAMSDREVSPGSKKKRGRPKSESRMDDEKRDLQDCDKPRLPHNEVERKYRESLNLGFERLRNTVPTLPKLDAGAASAAQKQSKAAVLAAAVDYIKYLEAENATLKEENRQIRMQVGDGGDGETRRRGGRRT